MHSKNIYIYIYNYSFIIFLFSSHMNTTSNEEFPCNIYCHVDMARPYQAELYMQLNNVDGQSLRI